MYGCSGHFSSYKTRKQQSKIDVTEDLNVRSVRDTRSEQRDNNTAALDHQFTQVGSIIIIL